MNIFKVYIDALKHFIISIYVKHNLLFPSILIGIVLYIIFKAINPR